MKIRMAGREDVPGIMEIYNNAVLNTTATFDLEPKDESDRLRWFEAHQGNHPLLIAESGGQVAGYASLSSYREKEAYAATVELSIYVHKNYQRRGVGRQLMEEILSIAREREDIHTVISVITAGNQASDRLHQEFGFTHCGRLKDAGKKFGRFLDVDTYQIMV